MKKLTPPLDTEFYNYWETQSGKRIKISDMNTSHILNSIKKIKSSPSGWRIEYLETLENEIKKRGITARSDEFEKNLITDEEKMYFLSTSCEYQFVNPTELKHITSLSSKILTYIGNNIFCIPEKDNKEEFISNMEKLANDIITEESDFFSIYEKYLIVNVFSREWSQFMNLMLGRK